MSFKAGRETTRRLHEKKRRHEKRMSAVFTTLLMVACGLLGYMVATYVPTETQAQLVDAEGLPEAIQTIAAASRLCRSQAGINYGSSLIEALIDDYSTRYDKNRDLFVVLLMTSVAEPKVGSKEYRVHCHVIPKETVVHYFKGFEV